jgi:hypothetical protein
MNPLGDNLVVLLVLALGGALAVGNILALVKPRENPETGEIERPPTGPSVAMLVVGSIATVWALISLVV